MTYISAMLLGKRRAEEIDRSATTLLLEGVFRITAEFVFSGRYGSFRSPFCIV
jgi:hypothetical protein